MTATIQINAVPYLDIDSFFNWWFSDWNSGNGVLPTYTRTGAVTDATTYVNNITWTDGRTQPTWQEVQDNYQNAWYNYRQSRFEQDYPAVYKAASVDLPAAIAALTSAQTRTISSLSLSLVGTGATGTQIHATKDSTVRATCSTSTTVTLGGSPTSIVIMKTCATNSSTEGNWSEVGRTESDQPTTLSVTVGQQVKSSGQICADVPAGYYVKLVNSGSGTHAEAFVSGQKTIYG